jgi:hypothetical protein
LYCYRDDDKVFIETTLETFFRNYAYPWKGAANANAKFQKVETTKRDGLTITKYRSRSIFGGILDLSLVDSPVVAPQVSDLILAYYRTGAARGVLYGERHELKPQPHEKLGEWSYKGIVDPDKKDIVVTSQVKKIAYRASDFESPKGYRQVTDGVDITLSRSQKKHTVTLIDDLDLGVPFGTKKKQPSKDVVSP